MTEVLLKLSVFKDINRVFYIEGSISINIKSTTFIRCTRSDSNGCFYFYLTGTAQVIIENTCFISCVANLNGVGAIYIQKEKISFVQISVSDMNRDSQRDCLYLYYGEHFINDLNTSSSKGISPMVTAESAIKGEYKFMLSCGNNPYQGISFFRNESPKLQSCIIISTNFMSSGNGVITLSSSTASIISCDFVKNNGPLFYCGSSQATCSDCFFLNNFETNTYYGVSIVSTRNQGKEELWNAMTHICHMQIAFTDKTLTKFLSIFLSAFIN